MRTQTLYLADCRINMFHFAMGVRPDESTRRNKKKVFTIVLLLPNQHPPTRRNYNFMIYSQLSDKSKRPFDLYNFLI